LEFSNLVEGFEFKVKGFGMRVEGPAFEFRVEGLGIGGEGSGFLVESSWFRVYGEECTLKV